MTEKTLIDIIGWLAMILILTAYYLISAGKVTGKNVSYQVLNFAGAFLFIINLSYMKAWPSVALNIVWALIAIAALIPILNNKKAGQSRNDDDKS